MDRVETGGAAAAEWSGALGGAALQRRVIFPDRLTGQERADFAQRLYEVHCRIFAGVTAEDFRSHVVVPSGQATAIQVYVSEQGEFVGYCAFHRFRRRVQGRDTILLRAQAGLLPEYRGRGSTYGFGILRAIVEKLRHPFTPIFYYGTVVHMSSYHLFCKYFRRLVPRPDSDPSPGLRAAAVELADSMSYPRVDPDDPFVRDTGWVTIESPQEKALRRWERSDVAFFKRRDPGYAQGHGLVTVIPVTFGNILVALALRLWEKVRLWLGRRHPEL